MRRVPDVAVLALVLTVLLTSIDLSGQIDAGYLANVEDGKITVTHSNVENWTEVALGLVPMDRSGTGVTLMFRARFPGRTVDVDKPSEMVVRAHYRLHANEGPRSARSLQDSQMLRFNLDPGDKGQVTLAFFATNWGYGGFSAPGDEIPVAYFKVMPADVRALAMARAVTGQALWADFELTNAQLVALRKFAGQVLPVPRRR